MPSDPPTLDAAASQVSDDIFLARQPILGPDENVVAYELLFRNADEAEAGVTDHAAATAAVIAHASQLGMDLVVGEKPAFVNVDEVVLMSDFIRFLPPGKVILELLETVKATPAVIERVRELKAAGFTFALDDVVDQSVDVLKLMSLVDVIKVDLQGIDWDALPQMAKTWRAGGRKLLAEKVETVDQFEACLKLGFEYYQGYFFSKPKILTGKKVAPSELVLLHLLDLVSANAGQSEIEQSADGDLRIRENLLRLVNTPAAGVTGKIQSLSQALEVLGPRQLKRWLQILIYSKPGAPMDIDSPLLQMATARGRMIELMAMRRHPDDKAAADTGFTVGILSLMDAMFGMSMADVLGSIRVPDEVSAALLERKGEFGLMLRVTELLEKPEQWMELKQLLKELGLCVREVREIEIAAFKWFNELERQLH